MARRTTSSTVSPARDGRAGLAGRYVQRRRTRARCQAKDRLGVTRNAPQRSLGTRRARAAVSARSDQAKRGPGNRLWEPCDGRLSRPVLREREGEVPSRYPPGFELMVLMIAAPTLTPAVPTSSWGDPRRGLRRR